MAVLGRGRAVWDRCCTWLATHAPGGGETLIGSVGVVFAGAGAGIVASDAGPTPPVELGFTVFMDIGLAVTAVATAFYVRRTFPVPRHRWLVAASYVGGVAFLFALYSWATFPAIAADPATVVRNADSYVLYGNLGGILGLIAGFNRARAAQNRGLVVDLRRKNDTLEFINHLLRHEVLNSTQSIHGYAEMVAADVDDPTHVERLGRVTDASSRISQLIEDVRLLMNTVEGEVETRPVDLSELVEEEVATAREKYPGATFTADVDPNVVARGNRMVGPVVSNLLQNAVDHNDREEPRVEVTATATSDGVVVEVADDGPGIAQSIRESLFQVDEKGAESTGMGIGLYLVREIVQALDGSVAIEDNDPRGTVVRVTLPAAGGNA